MISKIFWIYVVIGVSIIFFNNRITSYVYNLILIFTDKANLNDLFLFKTDNTNIDLLFRIARYIIITFGLSIALLSLYYIAP